MMNVDISTLVQVSICPWYLHCCFLCFVRSKFIGL